MLFLLDAGEKKTQAVNREIAKKKNTRNDIIINKKIQTQQNVPLKILCVYATWIKYKLVFLLGKNY